MPPVEVSTIRSKWSTTLPSMSDSTVARNDAGRTPRTPPPSIASTRLTARPSSGRSSRPGGDATPQSRRPCSAPSTQDRNPPSSRRWRRRLCPACSASRDAPRQAIRVREWAIRAVFSLDVSWKVVEVASTRPARHAASITQRTPGTSVKRPREAVLGRSRRAHPDVRTHRTRGVADERHRVRPSTAAAAEGHARTWETANSNAGLGALS
jgi:hypothetical protein